MNCDSTLLNWKKYKQVIQLCYGIYNETKYIVLWNSNLFLVSMNVSEQSFPN